MIQSLPPDLTTGPPGGPTEALKPLHPSARKAWMIKLMLLSAMIIAGALIYDLIGIFSVDRSLPLGLVTGSSIVVTVTFSIVFPRLWYRFWRYALRDEVLFLERGIINRVRTVVPLRRIQHLDVSQDIIEREFDLGKLIVHTAGTRSSDVVLPGLAFEEAERLRDELKDFILEDTI